MSPVDNIERRIEQFHVSTGAETDKRILNDSSAALRRGSRERQGGVWRLILDSRFARPVAAAAVILIAIGLFMSMPRKGADTVEEFYRTLGGAGNICVSAFEAGQTSPHQQVWTSQSLKVRLFKTGSGEQSRFALLDVSNKVRMTIFLSKVETEPLTEERLAELEKSVALLSDVAPFPDAKDVPEHARWSRVNDAAVEAIVPGCAVYDLVWALQGAVSEGDAYRLWRVFVDTKTHLPRRAESYAKSEPDEEYTLDSFVIVTYPSESEIQDVVASAFGPPGSRGGPEYIGTPGTDR